ncbi:hypothetical protein [Streptomyces sp. NPDC057301]|uniref:hypothetical protein n=1 Tax=Streptomyces sp. NPDC057301 TaxID=3346093 RepID=UPI00363BEE69
MEPDGRLAQLGAIRELPHRDALGFPELDESFRQPHETYRAALAVEARVLGALGLDARTVPIPERPCPWCASELLLHTDPDGPPTVTCTTGPSCTAPVRCDERGRRVWGWRELPALVVALDAAEQHAHGAVAA